MKVATSGMRILRTGRKGVSLAELLISIVILASSVLLVLGLFSAGSVRIRQARAVAAASFLAKEKMEEVLVESPIANSDGAFNEPFMDFSYEVRVKEYPEDSLLQQIEVTVIVPQSSGGRRITMVMLIPL